MASDKTDVCADCAVSIGEDGERPESRFHDDLCVVCGLEEISPLG